MGSYVGSFDVINYEEKPVGSLPENLLNKSPYAEMVGSVFGP